MELCSRDGAQRKINGLTPVNEEVVATVFGLARWKMTDQIIRICKPLVDIIGDVESRDATLADCMLQLIWAHRAVVNSPLMEGDDPAFADHAKTTLNIHFHAMNTDIHWKLHYSFTPFAENSLFRLLLIPENLPTPIGLP